MDNKNGISRCLQDEYASLFNRLLVLFIVGGILTNVYVTIFWVSIGWRFEILIGYLANITIALLWFARHRTSLAIRAHILMFIGTLTFIYGFLSIGYITPYHGLPTFIIAMAFVFIGIRAALLQSMIILAVYAIVVPLISTDTYYLKLSYQSAINDLTFQVYYFSSTVMGMVFFFYFLYRYTGILSSVSVENERLASRNKALIEAISEAPFSLAIWDKNSRLLFSNDKFSAALASIGVTANTELTYEELLKISLGRNDHKMSEEDQALWFNQRVEDFYSGYSTHEYQTSEGRYVSGVDTHISNGSIATYRADITDIRATEDKLRFIMANVTERIMTLTKDGRITYANAGVLSSFGSSSVELVGGSIYQWFGDRHQQRIGKILNQLGEELNKPLYFQDVEVKRKSGETFLVDMRCSASQLGNEIEILVVFYDSSALTATELSVKQLTEAFRKIDVGIVMISTVGEITFFNESLRKMFNETVTPVLGQSFLTFSRSITTAEEYFSHNRSDIVERLERAYVNSGTGIEMSNGYGQFLHISFFKLSDGSRLCMIIDITESKIVNEQLLQSGKLASLGEMATGIAHEINQPLSVIKLAAQNLEHTLSTGPSYSEPVQKRIKRILSQVDRAAKIIDQMRMYGREAKEPTAVANPLVCINESLEMLSGEFKLAGILATTKLPETLPDINIHPIKLVQVLVALLSNAKDAFIDNNIDIENRHILFCAKFNESRSLELSVKDNAGGIPSEIIDRIMDPFFTTKAPGNGTGLGLSIASRIISDANGTLTCSNDSTGAVFTITCPLYQGDQLEQVMPY